MSINTRLPVFNISTQKLSLSADTESVLWCGVEYPTVNFVSVVVPSLLAYLPLIALARSTCCLKWMPTDLAFVVTASTPLHGVKP